MTPTRVVNVHVDRGPDVVFVGRPSKWGNPFRVGADGTRAEVLERYRAYLRRRPDLVAAARAELRGKALGCFCPPLPCHAEILMDVAEGGDP